MEKDNKHLDLDDVEHRTKAQKMLRSAKVMEKKLEKQNKLTRIAIRGGYIMTNNPEMYKEVCR